MGSFIVPAFKNTANLNKDLVCWTSQMWLTRLKLVLRLRSKIFKVCNLAGKKTLLSVVESILFVFYLYSEAGQYQFVKKVI